MTKPWSMARFIAQPPMPKTIANMQKFRPKSNVATDFNCVLAIFVLKAVERRKMCRFSGTKSRIDRNGLQTTRGVHVFCRIGVGL